MKGDRLWKPRNHQSAEKQQYWGRAAAKMLQTKEETLTHKNGQSGQMKGSELLADCPRESHLDSELVIKQVQNEDSIPMILHNSNEERRGKSLNNSFKQYVLQHKPGARKTAGPVPSSRRFILEEREVILMQCRNYTERVNPGL